MDYIFHKWYLSTCVFPEIDADINEPSPIQVAATGYTDYASKSDHDLPEDDLLAFHKDSMTCYQKASSLR